MFKLKPLLSASTALFLCSLSVIPAMAGEANDFATVSGSVTYHQRIAMLPGALLTVRIEDVSLADVPAILLAEISEPFGTRQVPIVFSLKMPSASITGFESL